MKRKTLTLVLCLLATFALASIGFASWIISNPDVSVEGTTVGDFTVYNAVDQSVGLSYSFDTNALDKTGFIFGKPADTSTVLNPWLTFSNDMKVEDLTVNMTLTVTSPSYLANDLKVYFYVAKGSALETAISNKYIKCVNGDFAYKTISVGGTNTEVYAVEITVSKGDVSDESHVVTFEFAWGDAFKYEGNNVNPYFYYNAGDYTTSAETTLNALAGLNNLKFNVLITA